MSVRPLLTLQTDFGVGDPYGGAMRGRILQLCPEARMVDLKHEAPPQDRRAAAFVLGANWGALPLGRKHLTVIDPGVGTAQGPLAMRVAGPRHESAGTLGLARREGSLARGCHVATGDRVRVIASRD